MTDDMTPFEAMLKRDEIEPPVNPVSCVLVWIGLLLLSAFCIVGAVTTIAWLLS